MKAPYEGSEAEARDDAAAFRDDEMSVVERFTAPPAEDFTPTDDSGDGFEVPDDGTFDETGIAPDQAAPQPTDAPQSGLELFRADVANMQPEVVDQYFAALPVEAQQQLAAEYAQEQTRMATQQARGDFLGAVDEHYRYQGERQQMAEQQAQQEYAESVAALHEMVDGAKQQVRTNVDNETIIGYASAAYQDAAGQGIEMSDEEQRQLVHAATEYADTMAITDNVLRKVFYR